MSRTVSGENTQPIDYEIRCGGCGLKYRTHDPMGYGRTQARNGGWSVGIEIRCPRCPKEGKQ